MIFSRTQKEHDIAIEEVLQALTEAGLTINLEKCEFSKDSLVFFGLLFSAEGVGPDPAKVLALKQAEPPTTKGN